MPNIHHFLTEHNLWNTWESAFYNGFLSSFHFSLIHLPENKKGQIFDIAIPFMQQFSLDRIKTLLPSEKQDMWHLILNRTCLSHPYTKRLMIKGITLIKIKRANLKYTLSFLGIPLFSKKIKKQREVYRVLFIPVFKRKVTY